MLSPRLPEQGIAALITVQASFFLVPFKKVQEALLEAVAAG
jgi:hypothetical protein